MCVCECVCVCVCARACVFVRQEEFCYLNTKAARRRLARALHAVPRNNLSLLPYYARLCAVRLRLRRWFAELVRRVQSSNGRGARPRPSLIC